jgi:hypothetical protein
MPFYGNSDNSNSSNYQNSEHRKQANYDGYMRTDYYNKNQTNDTRLQEFIKRDPSVYLIAESWSKPKLN